jgi:1,4-dihydroxy-2-naphthoate octaprenyltransferase
MWTMLGCVLSHRLFPAFIPYKSATSDSAIPAPFDWLVLAQCMVVTWGTNISINYANEYFDWDLDRPGQIESISREVSLRKAAKEAEAGGQAAVKAKETKMQLNEKIMGNTTRIIHDGTFPPWTALVLGASVQALLVLLLLTSRASDPELAPHPYASPVGSQAGQGLVGRLTPYKGAAMWIGIVSTILSHEYIAPPLRLHYHGWGELMSAVLLSPASVLWGMTGYYTATHSALSFSDLIPSFSPLTTGTSTPSPSSASYRFVIDRYLLAFFAIIYLLEQARILVMHIHDIKADTLGGKVTLSVRLGHKRACQAYVGLNVMGVTLLGMLLARLAKGDAGSLSRIAGDSPLGWRLIGAWSAILALALPIMAVVAKTLFAHGPAEDKQASMAEPDKSGLIPVLAITEPPKLVSLQVLATPILLATFLGAV